MLPSTPSLFLIDISSTCSLPVGWWTICVITGEGVNVCPSAEVPVSSRLVSSPPWPNQASQFPYCACPDDPLLRRRLQKLGSTNNVGWW